MNNALTVEEIVNNRRNLSLAEVITSKALIGIIERIESFMSSIGYLDKVYVRHKQKLLQDRSIQVNKASKTHHEILRVCITYQCNRDDCSFCYSAGLQEEFKDHMSIEDFEFLTHWAKSQGWKSFRLLGGEPTIHPDFKTILDIARKEKFSVSFSTNGLYEPELNSFFDKDLVESINVSYSQSQLLPEQRQVIHHNIQEIVNKKIPLVLSWVMCPDDYGWYRVIDLAKNFRTKTIVRFSMILPGYQRHFTSKELQENLKELAKQSLEIARYAYQNYVAFFFYRPLLYCMFSLTEFKFLQSISPFLFETLCACSSLEGSCMVTINPDLTCYPCPVLFVKGIKINLQTTRKTIDQFFKTNLKNLVIQPLMESCENCPFFTNYKHWLEDKHFDNGAICQAGCPQYRLQDGSCPSVLD